MANNSDYTKPRTKLHELLPDVFQSDVNESMFENAFNRFLTKNETTRIAGYVGEGNPNAIIKRQIHEPTLHRQAFQLQPIVNAKIGSEEYMSSWKDFENEIERLGINLDNISTWGSVLQFNWIPPVDLDKIINFQDYYWYDEVSPNSRPDYITIKSRCTTAQAYVNFWNRLIASYGSTIPITDILETVDTTPGYNRFTFTGDYSKLFEPGFMMYVKQSTNVDLNLQTFEVSDSVYSDVTGITIVSLTTSFTDGTVSGVISLDEQYAFALLERDCQCTGALGWDQNQWDDNTDAPLWAAKPGANPALDGDSEIHASLIARITSNISPLAPPNSGAGTEPNGTVIPPQSGASVAPLWYDTTTDILWQYGGNITFSGPNAYTGGTWAAVVDNFSEIVASTVGTALWDQAAACGAGAQIPSAGQWSGNNKWYHKTDVPNFTVAKRAEFPIIEYFANLELNEWTYTGYVWRYRPATFGTWRDTTLDPGMIELKPLETYTMQSSNAVSNMVIRLDPSYGDQTFWFTNGKKFRADGFISVLEVEKSWFATDGGSNAFYTFVLLKTAAALVSGTHDLYPFFTSEGDLWEGYDTHWAFVGAENTLPVNHQPTNPYITVDRTAAYTEYAPPTTVKYLTSEYAQEYQLKSQGSVSRYALDATLQGRALLGFDDIRVYTDINATGIFTRQYGTYIELNKVEYTGVPSALPADNLYVYGIEFISGYAPQTTGSGIRIEVCEASSKDFGLNAIDVRTDESDTDYIANGKTTVSLIRYRKVEQIKDTVNVYPLFDLYNVDGTSAYTASPIFAYQTSPDAPIQTELGIRLVLDTTIKDYGFEQFLYDEDLKKLYAYRDFANQQSNYWVDTKSEQVYVWDDTSYLWSPVQELSDGTDLFEVTPTYGYDRPLNTDLVGQLDGYLWYDTTNGVLRQRILPGNTSASWSPINGAIISDNDHTLQTIWRKGKNNELYVPAKVDWVNRTFEEYENERVLYERETAEELIIGGMSEVDAYTQAHTDWLTSQINDHSSTGEWVGDWEIPDPLYFNTQHENKRSISYRELLTHFNSIINAQPKIPGFNGPRNSMYHLIPSEDINYGLGGRIKEFNDGYDTFISSIFVDNVTPLTLYQLARDQYESLLNNLRENYRRSLLLLLTDTSTESLVDQSLFLSTSVINSVEENDNLALVYGDSTTFSEGVDGAPDKGIRNWIATLPYLSLVPRSQPMRLQDDAANIDIVLHHDGHYTQYDMSTTIMEGISRAITTFPDTRGDVPDTFGRVSTTVPPATIAAFESVFASTITNREGVYWYRVNGTTRTLYRLSVIAISTVEPSSETPDDIMWIDLSTNTLRRKNGLVWDAIAPVDDISLAWTEVNFVDMLNDLAVTVETKLFENAPVDFVPPYTFDDVRTLDPTKYDQYLEAAFLDYIAEQRITAPYANAEYDATDPYTWNYKYSTPGRGFEIVDADSATQTIVISGNQLLTGSFATSATLYIKNDPVNEGEWYVTTPIATYDSLLDRTTVHVAGSSLIKDSSSGIVYTGTLPSTSNTGAESGGHWRDLYQKLYGTPYPHLEPWKLQGFVSKPDWWDDEYAYTGSPEGARRWNYTHSTEIGMWANIKNGVIPDGRTYPNGVIANAALEALPNQIRQAPTLTTYNYFSVNIGDTPIVADDGNTYNPDDLLPPYWFDSGNVDPTGIRSVFETMSNVVAPATDFAFGDAGPIEYEWRSSSQFLYDQLKASFRLDPVRCVSHTFGKQFLEVGGLQLDQDTYNTFCHCRTNFHGDIIGDILYQTNGSNQWYVNFNRYVGYDTNYSNFRSMWTQWSAPLTYQFSSFIDTQSFILGHRILTVTPFDWKIVSKHSRGVEDFWYDAFKVTVLDAPPPLMRYDNEKQWVFELGTNITAGRVISYYDVRNYQFYADAATDICSLYTYPIMSASSVDDRVYIKGDQTDVIVAGTSFTVISSSANDGDYIAEHVAYDPTTDRTIIDVNTLPSALAGGFVQLSYRILPWTTGDRIYLTTDETLPAPLLNETEYFIVVESPTTFKLARTASDALNGTTINLTTVGRNNHYVGQLNSTFVALDGYTTTTNWKHYELDRDAVLTLATPAELKGIQTIINIVDGYEAYQYDQGWRINETGELKDFDNPSRTVNWQLELERFINYIFGMRQQGRKPPSVLFDISLDEPTSTFTLLQDGASFITGDSVMVYADNYSYPSPLIANMTYYMIRESATAFKLAISKADAEKAIYIDFSVGSPTGQTYSLKLAPAKTYRNSIVTFEMNPFRNGIWFKPERGIVSNVITGPTEDVRSSQLVFDQYGRAMGRNNLQVLRQDKQTMVMVPTGIINDVSYSTDPYQSIHLGGAHLFVDTYEHVLVFNNYTTEGQLLYDPFVGLNVTKYELQYRRQLEFTQRPNVGGYYLQSKNNQESKLVRNIEASIEDLRYMYDTHTAPETETLIVESRKVLGYEGVRDYFNNLNLGPKSQFVYWKGMIQQKGSVNAIQAFINSRRFLDAKVDEFWAVKIADFGSAAEKEYPAIYLTTQDARSNELRLEFAIDEDLCIPGYAMNVYDQMPCGYAFPEDGNPILIGADGFVPVLITDDVRWYEQPDQVATLQNNGETLYFTLKPNGVVPITFVSDVVCVPGPNQADCVYVNPFDPADEDTSEAFKLGNVSHDQGIVYYSTATGRRTFYRWNAGAQSWISNGEWAGSTLPIVRHGLSCDHVEVTLDLYSDGISAGGCETVEFITPPSATNNLISCTLSDFVGLPRQITADDGLIPYVPFANSIKVFKQQNLPILETTAYNPGSPATITVAGDYSDSILVDTTISLETNTHMSLTSVTVDAVEIVYGDPGNWESVTQSPTAPVSPSDGDFWLNTTTNVLYFYDASGSPDVGWVEAGAFGAADPYTRITLKDKLENTLSTPISSFKYVAQGRLLVSGVDYAETLNPSGALLSEKIQFPVKLQPTDTIKIVYGTATLSSDLHYEIINSDVIRFAFPEITNGVESLGSPVTVGFVQNLKIWGMVQDDNTQDPAKIIDVKANVVVTPVQLWDPARSSHYYLADRSIDIWRTTDPARYTHTDVTNQVVGAPIVGPPTDGPVDVPVEGPTVTPTPPPPPPPPPPPEDVTPVPPVDPIEASLAASLASLEGLLVESVIPNTVNTYAYAAVTFAIDGNIETSITIGTPSISTPITVLGPWKTGGGTTANYELWAEKVSESISHPVANSTPSAISSLPSSGYGQWLPMGGSTDKAFYALADFDHPTEALEAVVQVKFKIRSAATGNILAQMTTPVTIRAYSAAP